MAAVDFLGFREEWANRGPRATCRVGWQAQGKKVAPSAVAAQAIEAQPVFGQIKPWRGRVAARQTASLRGKRGGRWLPRTRGPAFQAKKKKSWGTDRTPPESDQSVQTATLPMERVFVGLEALANPSVARTAAYLVTPTSGHRTDIN
ncbi:MAG: hypothetical protein ACYC5H_04785 [Methylovirgula sp.]